MNLQQISESPFIISLVSILGRILPVRTGYALADLVAVQIASRQGSQMVRAIRANQWVARGESLGKDALDQAVLETLRQSAHSIFDMYHYVQNHETTRNLIDLDPVTEKLYQNREFSQRGLVVAGLHLSNFDLILQWACQEGFKPLILTIPDPQGGRGKEYERRKKSGMNILPASIGALRQALTHLQQGGIVLTGIDRPIPDPKATPLFFRRPAALPMHHIFLALKAKVPIVVMRANLQAKGKYHILTSESIEMDPHPDRDTEMLLNAEKVLSLAEKYIRQTPQQWSISLPVWPETLSMVP
jgi:lauroyl/myristoyl acyltransferase